MGFSPINLAGDGSARSAEDRRAISVRLATVKRGQSLLLRVFEAGCSATLSAAIYPIPKLTVQLMKIGLASEGMRVASLAPAVGVFTPAGTCPGRLRRHCVIGAPTLDRTRLPQGPAAVGFEGGAWAGQQRGRCPGAGLAAVMTARVPRLSVGHDRRRRCVASPETVRSPRDGSYGRGGKGTGTANQQPVL
jgi:hypothetical protein